MRHEFAIDPVQDRLEVVSFPGILRVEKLQETVRASQHGSRSALMLERRALLGRNTREIADHTVMVRVQIHHLKPDVRAHAFAETCVQGKCTCMKPFMYAIHKHVPFHSHASAGVHRFKLCSFGTRACICIKRSHTHRVIRAVSMYLRATLASVEPDTTNLQSRGQS